MHTLMQKTHTDMDRRMGTIYIQLLNYLKDNIFVIISISLVALCGYGFELFNLNLTIDEEVWAAYAAPIVWISEGRWGMFLLNKFLVPYPVIPFVPLFLALFFQLAAILLMLESLEVKGQLEKIMIGSLAIAYPGMAYMYMFSTLNYGIGIGLFCVALSLFVYVKNRGLWKFLAVIPATFAISIYQGLLPALFSIFLLYIIKAWDSLDTKKIKTIVNIISICVISILLYALILKFITVVGRIPTSNYINSRFNFDYLRNNFSNSLSSLFPFLVNVYSGSRLIYGLEIPGLGMLIILSLLGICIGTWKSELIFANKVLLLLFSIIFLLVPFVSLLLSGGNMVMRFLVCLPITISGWVILGMKQNGKMFKFISAILAIACVLQFMTSTNYLFASSHLALEQDRLLGSQLINRIAEQANTEIDDLKYLEVVGYLDRSPTQLVPKLDTFGASFFEWDQGSVRRILLFLQTLGYNELQAMPMDQRAQMVETAIAMPIWPDRGSVKVIGDVALVKFGPYSDIQKFYICQPSENSSQLQNLGFCLK